MQKYRATMLDARTAAKNLVRNGGMELWQRGTNFPPVEATTVYTADGWLRFDGKGNSAWTVACSDDVPPGVRVRHSLQCTVTEGERDLMLRQLFDNNLHFRGPLTLSCWVKGPAGAQAAMDIVDHGITHVYSGEWQHVTFTVAAPPLMDCPWITLMRAPKQAGVYNITAVQLMAGEQASEFVPESPQQIYAECARYYEVLNGLIFVLPIPIYPRAGMIQNGFYKVRKRIPPRIIWDGLIYDGDGVGVIGTGTPRYGTLDGFGTITFDFDPVVGNSYAIKGVVADAEI